MKKAFIAAAMVCMGIAQVQGASSPQPQAQGQDPAFKGGAAAVTEAETEGEVVMVNHAQKKVTIKEADGKRLTIRVPAETQSLEQLTPGSRFRVRYAQAVALAIGKPGAAPALEEEDMRMAPRSGVPGEAAATTRQITAVIQNIDRDKRELTVQGPEGDTLRLKVADDVPGFDQAQVGDTAVINHTEAVALEVLK